MKLNGNTGWVSILIVLIIQSVSFGMWMGRVELKTTTALEKVAELKADLTKDIDEIKNRLSHRRY